MCCDTMIGLAYQGMCINLTELAQCHQWKAASLFCRTQLGLLTGACLIFVCKQERLFALVDSRNGRTGFAAAEVHIKAPWDGSLRIKQPCSYSFEELPSSLYQMLKWQQRERNSVILYVTAGRFSVLLTQSVRSHQEVAAAVTFSERPQQPSSILLL